MDKLFRHLLVPLDGSRLAESVLPVAAELTRRLRGRITLLHAVEPHAPATVHGDRHLSRPAEAEAYLKGAVDWLAGRGVQADRVVLHAEGDVAASIASSAAHLRADLIVLSTHGSSGVKGLLFGRVAQQVLQRGTVPVFLVQPSGQGREQSFVCRRILVPLDGSETAEAAVPVASALAGAFDATTLLVWVVPTVVTISGDRGVATRLMPTAAAVLLETEASQAVIYLEQVAARLRAEGRTVEASVERGEPVNVLLDTVVRRDVDLTVMATHGRSGVSAVWAGSVASRIVAAGSRPILLVRIPPAEKT